MSMPPISPTGAMASGEYTDYMMTYLSSAIDYVDDQLSAYLGEETLGEWESRWNVSILDVNTMITDINNRVGKLTAQSRAAKDGISKL